MKIEKIVAIGIGVVIGKLLVENRKLRRQQEARKKQRVLKRLHLEKIYSRR